ncbi:hypothetical protein BC831DRAFT_479551 [Entophlyctis helioformis]|nr:hypothetical protein BC831DRAFT_479551 [Entophlyctis helioformis]
MDTARQSAFVRLKPACVACLDPSVWALGRRDSSTHPVARLSLELRALAAALARTPADPSAPAGAADVLAPLLEYVAFPLVEALKSRKASPTTIELIANCLRFLVATCSRSSLYRMPPSLLLHLLMELPLAGSARIRPPSQQQPTSASAPASASVSSDRPSEDLKAAVTDCLLALFNAEQLLQSRGSGLSLDWTAPQLQPVLAHIITMLLDNVALERSLDLRLSSLDALRVLVGILAHPDRLAQFFPGIVSGLTKVLLADEKHNHKLVVSCLDLLCDTFKRTLGDTVSAAFTPDTGSTRDLLLQIQSLAAPSQHVPDASSPEEPDSAVALAHQQSLHQQQATPGAFERSREWFDDTVSKVSIVLPKLGKLRLHQHQAVRRAMMDLAAQLLDSCAVSLAASTGFLVDTVILLHAADSDPDDPDAQSAMSRIRQAVATSPETVSRIRDCLSSILSETLPTSLASTSEPAQFEALLLVNGYIRLLQHQSAAALQGGSQPLVRALTSLLVFDLDGVRIVEQRHAFAGAELVQMDTVESRLSDGSSLALTAAPERRFKTFRDARILAQARCLCRLDMTPLLHDAATRAAALFVINEVYDAYWRQQEASALLQSVISDYLSLPVLAQPTNAIDRRLFLASNHPKPLLRNKMHTSECILANSLILEGLGMMASVLSPEDATLVLMDGLYPILEKLGDRNHAVNTAATWALQQFALKCASPSSGHAIHQHALVPLEPAAPTISSLVLAHVDYLIDSVSRRLRFVTQNPLAPKVLTAAIRVTGPEIVGPLMTDCVELLVDILDDLGTAGNGLQLLDVAGDAGKHVPLAVTVSSLHPDDPGLPGEVLSVLYALIEVMASARQSKPPTASASSTRPSLLDNATPVPTRSTTLAVTAGSDVDLDARLGIPSCSAELREYFVERRNQALDVGSSETETEDQHQTAKEYFEARIKAADEAKKNMPRADEDGVPLDTDEAGAGDADTDANDRMMQASEQREPSAPEPTPFEKVALQILSKALHFLASDAPLLRARVLRMFRMGIPLLAARPTDLNPLIHTLWPKLMRRCQDKQHYVVLEAVETVGVITSTSPDFVRKRVADDVLPPFIKLLKSLQRDVETASAASPAGATATGKLTTVSHRHHLSHAITTHATQNRLFMRSLETLGAIIDAIPALQRSDQDKIAGSLMGLLNARLYALNVQQAALNLLLRFVERSGSDWVWALCWMTAGASRLEYTGEATDLRDVHITDQLRKTFMPFGVPADYAANLAVLLDACSGRLSAEWLTVHDGHGLWHRRATK